MTELEAPLLHSKYEEQVDNFLRYDMMHSILSGIAESAIYVRNSLHVIRL